ncbi:hypothetical protein GIB67_009732 [Kingdonia uniflora]|uniref:Uncharacterized protein n=1 Tax=Kingdonia uniflora TaxID=39325 RepID=A0A7J7LB78_9MAGN|nr:hypothetical protein GIB67_009732 [Kingdonia uniflora]
MSAQTKKAAESCIPLENPNISGYTTDVMAAKRGAILSGGFGRAGKKKRPMTLSPYGTAPTLKNSNTSVPKGVEAGTRAGKLLPVSQQKNVETNQALKAIADVSIEMEQNFDDCLAGAEIIPIFFFEGQMFMNNIKKLLLNSKPQFFGGQNLANEVLVLKNIKKELVAEKTAIEVDFKIFKSQAAKDRKTINREAKLTWEGENGKNLRR